MACNGDPVDTPARPTQQRQIDLQIAVVHYADSPDRCTLFPPSADDTTLMATWLSFDRDIIVSLETMR